MTILPTEAHDLAPREFVKYARAAYERGFCPVPVGKPEGAKPAKPAGKAPWLRGLTGYDGIDSSETAFERWPTTVARMKRRHPDGILSLATRMPVGVVGIDVDDYTAPGGTVKRGLVTVAELERRFGPLPPTMRITARGFDNGSGIRLYRVPDDWVGPTELKTSDGSPGDIELIQRHHRVAVLPPSIHHTGQHYAAYDEASGQPCDLLPVDELPKLPDGWLDALRRTPTGAGGGADPRQVRAFTKAHTAEHWPSMLTPIVEGVRTTAQTRNVARDRLCQAARESRAGCYSFSRAVDELRAAAEQSYASRGRALDEKEFTALVGYAVTQAEAVPRVELSRRVARARGFSSVATMRLAEFALAPGGRWHPDTPVSKKRRRENQNTAPVTRSLVDVPRTQVNWLWRPWIPLGKLSILEGEPDVGKSVLTLTVAAIVSTGRRFPTSLVDGESVPQGKAKPGGVVLVGIEDDEGDTIVPRLHAAGADLSHVHTLIAPTDAKGNPVAFVIPDDVDRLRRAIIEARARLVVIDPITAYLSTRQVKAGDDPSTRQALMPLVELARDTGAAILLVRHLNKAAGMSAKNRGSGTVAYGGLSRSVIVAGKIHDAQPDGPTHAIALTKGNLSKDPASIGYRLDSAPDDPDSPVVRLLGPVSLTADQLVGADGAKTGDARRSAPTREECEMLLRELLADGPMPSAEAMRAVRTGVGCSSKPVKEAAANIGVVKKRVYVDKKVDHWTWELLPVKTSVPIRRRSAAGQQK